jgi:hypothetical protein
MMEAVHGATIHKTAIFIPVVVRTSSHTYVNGISHEKGNQQEIESVCTRTVYVINILQKKVFSYSNSRMQLEIIMKLFGL